jgi:hypothetical protein
MPSWVEFAMSKFVVLECLWDEDSGVIDEE